MSRQPAKRKSPESRQDRVGALLALPFVGVAICAAKDLRWTQINDRLCAMLGRTRADLLRRHWTEVCHADDRAAGQEALRRLRTTTGAPVRVRLRFCHAEGHDVPADIELSRLQGRAGSAGERYVALVTEAAPASGALGILAQAETPVLVIDAGRGDVVEANPAAERFYGQTLADMRSRGLHVWDVSLSRRADVVARLREAAAGRAGRFEAQHRTARDELKEVEIHCGPVTLDGRACVYGIVHDRTELKRAESARLEAEEKLKAVIEQSISGIYIIEDGRFTYVNPRLAEIFGYAPAEVLGLPALELVDPPDRDRVTENIRRRLEGAVASIKYEFRGRRRDGSVVNIGAHGSVAMISGRRVIVGTLQDITARVQNEQRREIDLARLEAAMQAAVQTITRIVELRDPYTAGHERRVAGLSLLFARELGMDTDRLRGLAIAGGLHDIGKIGVPVEVLVKPTRLSAAEFQVVKDHAAHGYDILRVMDFPWPVADAARQHHERIDGSGYPQGLKGSAILQEARILAVADVIEAMASHRPYRAALGLAPALEEIERGAGRLYDAEVSAVALRTCRADGFRLPA